MDCDNKICYYAIKYIIRLIYLQAEVTGGTVRQLETLSVSYTYSVVAYVQRIKKLVERTGKLGTFFNILPTSELQCFRNWFAEYLKVFCTRSTINIIPKNGNFKLTQNYCSEVSCHLDS